MNVVVRWRGLEYETDVRVEDPVATTGQLAVALVGESDLRVAVDGVFVDADLPVVELGLCDGSIVELAREVDPRWVGRLTDVGPGRTGIDIPLLPGAIGVGAAPADVVVAGVTGRILLIADESGGVAIRNPDEVAVTVDGIAVGTDDIALSPGARIAVGDRVFAIGAAGGAVARSSRVFNRPPRPISRSHAVQIHPPPPEEESRGTTRFGWGALIVPLILGLAMAFFIHPRMAIFALFSPAMLLANWMEDRRRARRERRERGAVRTQLLARFRRQLADAHRIETLRRRSRVVPPQELPARAGHTDPRLWERRPGHDDFMSIPIGIGCLGWEPALAAPPCPDSSRIVAEFSELHDVPVSVTVAAGDVMGIAGERSEVLGVARQVLLQAAINHGPADLALSIFTERPDDWDWAKWLPHVQVDTAGKRRLAGLPDEIAAVASLLPAQSPESPAPLHLLVVDLPDLADAPRSLIREAIQSGEDLGIAAVAVAHRARDLPSLVKTILSTDKTRSEVRLPDGSSVVLSPWVLGAVAARGAARALAAITDPEATASGSGLPAGVHLNSLLGLGDDPATTIERNWRSDDVSYAVPIGVAADGPLLVDLVADGPHALLGGTTGAGKSELLRTLVASLAASVSPEALNFVLVDYKGGSAFDACAGLPHTVGLVTDLDEHLARRALICLEAELRYREERLRTAGVSDITSFAALAADPLPRLLVVVDEFAALATELPDFMDSLVGVAQRGRSLGVHLLLATQRPNGVISDSIKANTNLRIALRVQDVADSVDVIGSGAAAEISRSQPGRGLLRRGPGEVADFQTALVTGSSRSDGSAPVVAVPFVFAGEQPPPPIGSTPAPGDPTDLEAIVEAAAVVAARLDLGPARMPWPEVLPELLYLEDLATEIGSPEPAFALADEPHRQRRVPVRWSPTAGNLLLYGVPGSGTSTTLATLAVAMAANTGPDLLHMYVLDFDDQLLHPLGELDHVGSVVAGSDRERQVRLLRSLAAELQDRRTALAEGAWPPGGYPTIVTLLDNYGAFADAYGGPGDMAISNLVARLVADGPGVGMMTIITAKHAGDIPPRVASLVPSRLVFQLADRYDYTGLGVPAVDPPTLAGRAFESGSGREVHVALPHAAGLPAAVAAISWQPGEGVPRPIDVLPREVGIVDFAFAGRVSAEEWFLPLGIGDSSLDPVGLVLRDGDHALIAGPPRSGKTTALETLAHVAKAAEPGIRVVAVLPRRSPLLECRAIDAVVTSADVCRVTSERAPCLLLVDDAELVDDAAGLETLITARDLRVRIVASGVTEVIRGLYGHWTQDLRRSRIGCVLRPSLVSDGDLWQTQLPREAHNQFPVGRGYLLADGQAELVQLGRA